MRLILSFLLVSVTLSLSAQITLTSADLGDGGDTVRMSTATDQSIDFLTTGAAQTWDFSGLQPDGQILREFDDLSGLSTLAQIVFGSFAPTEYEATYSLPSTAIPVDQIPGVLPVTITDIRQFSRLTVDSLTLIGYSLNVEGNEVPVKSDTIETYLQLPLTFNDNYTSRGYTYLDMNPFFNAIWIQYRTRTSVVDGYGSITTPYGTFDAIRVKHSIQETDSIQIDFFGGPMWVELPVPDANIYEWYTTGEKDAVLRIETSDIGGNETVRNIEYRDNYLGLDASVYAVSQANITVYPNPARNKVSVDGLKGLSTYVIYDVEGAQIQSGVVNEHIDVSGLAPGTYQLILRAENGIFTEEIIKR
jgi:hypothetical protein